MVIQIIVSDFVDTKLPIKLKIGFSQSILKFLQTFGIFAQEELSLTNSISFTFWANAKTVKFISLSLAYFNWYFTNSFDRRSSSFDRRPWYFHYGMMKLTRVRFDFFVALFELLRFKYFQRPLFVKVSVCFIFQFKTMIQFIHICLPIVSFLLLGKGLLPVQFCNTVSSCPKSHSCRSYSFLIKSNIIHFCKFSHRVQG